MGKRQLAELQPSEFVVTLLVSELASMPMQDYGIPLTSGVVPIVLLVCIEVLLSYLLLKCRPVRKLVSGRPIEVIKDGKINQKNLFLLRETVEDLLKELRLKDVFDISSVIYAQIETNGKMSVLVSPNSQNSSKIPTCASLVVADGKLLKDNLSDSGYDAKWVEKNIKKSKFAGIEQIYLMTVDENGSTVILPKEGKG